MVNREMENNSDKFQGNQMVLRVVSGKNVSEGVFDKEISHSNFSKAVKGFYQ